MRYSEVERMVSARVLPTLKRGGVGGGGGVMISGRFSDDTVGNICQIQGTLN